jgi:hypothetical protein
MPPLPRSSGSPFAQSLPSAPMPSRDQIASLPPLNASSQSAPVAVAPAPSKCIWSLRGVIAQDGNQSGGWIAVLTSGKTTKFARVGTTLDDGEKVVSISRFGVILQSGSMKAILKIGAN